MNRLERLQAMLIQLQSKKIVRACEMAERYGVSERTVYRDIRALEAAGVPIGAEAGVGYFLLDTFNLPPVMFTDAEASSLLMGGKLVGQLVDQIVRSDYESALTKIQAVLRSSGKSHLEKLHEKIVVAKYTFCNVPPQNLYIGTVKKAITQELCLLLTYTAQYNGKTTQRIVEPIGLVYYGMEWHLIGYCRLRKEYRDFRLDRAETVSLSEFSFDPERTVSLQEYLKKYSQELTTETVQLVLHPSDLAYMRSVKHWFGNYDEIESDGECVVQFDVFDAQGLANWLLGFRNKVDVRKPDTLRNALLEMARNLAEWYC